MIKKVATLIFLVTLVACSLSINPHKRKDISFFKTKKHSFYFENRDFRIGFDFLFHLMDNFNVFDADMREVNILPVFIDIEKKNNDITFNFKKSYLKNSKGEKFRFIKLKTVWERLKKFYKIKFYNKHMLETFNNSFNNLLIKNSSNKTLSGFILFDVPKEYKLKDFIGGKIVLYGKYRDKKEKWKINIEKN